MLTPPVSVASTRTCYLWVEDGLLHGRFLDDAEVELEDARANLAETARLTSGRRLPALIDLRRVRTQSKEARALLAGPEAARVSVAVALLVDSPLSRVLGSFYLRFNRPTTPTALFTSTAEAERWLRQFEPGSVGEGADDR